MRKLLSITLLFLAASMSPALAAESQAIELKNIEKGKFEFDRQSGYVFLHGRSRQMGTLLKTPDADDIAEYEIEWRKQLEKAEKRYPSRLKDWEFEYSIAKNDGAREALLKKKPEAPTEENFSIGSIEMRQMVGFGPMYVFSKDKETDTFSYMVKLEPGTYSYYGPVFLDPNGGYTGQCYCMGSVEFEVRPGVITDLGNFLVVAPLQGIEPVDERPEISGSEAGVHSAQLMQYVASIQGNKVIYGLPEALSQYPSERADFRASRKRDNFYGISISRMPPIPGILGYEKGQVIDLKAKAEAMSPAQEPSMAMKTVLVEAETSADDREETADEMDILPLVN